MDRVEWFDQRFYKVTDKEGVIKFYPSVTTILNAYPKPFLAKWRGDLGNAEADKQMYEAAERGSRIHSLCEHLLNGGSISMNTNDEFNNMISFNQDEYFQAYKFQQLLEVLNPEIISVEEKVYNDKYEFAGTLDLIIKIKSGSYMIDGAKPVELQGGTYICDIKSGKYIDETAFYQLSAYSKCLPAKTKIKGSLVIHLAALTKKGIEGLSVKVHPASEMKEDFKNFMKIYELYKICPQPKPVIRDMPLVIKWEKTINNNNILNFKEAV